jgi:hypothetical protein
LSSFNTRKIFSPFSFLGGRALNFGGAWTEKKKKAVQELKGVGPTLFTKWEKLPNRVYLSHNSNASLSNKNHFSWRK